jgi:RND family efflux transporter MFP subunit
VSVVDVSTVIAVINVIERDFPDVLVGQATTLTTDAYGDREFVGKIVRRAPVLREESRQARVEVEIPNPERLLAPGMFVRASIQFAQHDGATVVPLTALARREGIQGVFVADTAAKKVRFEPVRTGFTEGGMVEVVEPQLEGYVVTLGHHLLEDGGTIALPEATP